MAWIEPVMERISSRQNSLVKSLRRLAESRRTRDEAGLVLSEGEHLLRTMLDAGIQPSMVVLAQRVSERESIRSLIQRCTDLRCVVMDDAIFDQIAPTDSPSGLLALSPMVAALPAPSHDIDTLVLEAVQDPGNVGSLIRTAAAVGIRQIVLSPGCADAWSPRCLRAAQGAQWLVRVYTEQAITAFLRDFEGDVAATLLEDGRSLYAHSLLKPVAWLFGNEGQGLSQQAIALANQRVTIPMPGDTESLNVNAAAAVCLFEQLRQRMASTR